MGKPIILFVFFQCALQLARGSDSKAWSVRTLRVDDLLAPSDFLPLARKLLEKVVYPGVGKGIVSSSKTYQQLADKIFQRFYFTNARFSPVRFVDIAGLDSLQALALSGDDYDPRSQFIPLKRYDFSKDAPKRCRYKLMTKKIDEKKHDKRYHKKATNDTKKLEKHKFKIVKTSHVSRGKFTQENSDPVDVIKTIKELQHRITPKKKVRQRREVKWENSTIAAPTTQNGRRNSPHIIPQAKNLLKNRMLVVKTDRKKREVVNEEPSKVHSLRRQANRGKIKKDSSLLAHGLDTTPTATVDEFTDDDEDNSEESLYDNTVLNIMRNVPPLKIDKENCYWQYKCPDHSGLRWIFYSCELIPECAGTASDHFIRDDIPIAHAADEHDPNLLRFRREVGVYLVDEEVEKIIERRYFLLMTVPKKEAKKTEVKNLEKKYGANLQVYFQNLIFAEQGITSTMTPLSKDIDRMKSAHKYKYLKRKNPYSDPKVQRQIREAKMKKAKEQHKEEFSSQQKEAVISLDMPITTPMPSFMHQRKK